MLPEIRHWRVCTPIYRRRVLNQVGVLLMIFHHILPNSISVQLRGYQNSKEVIKYQKNMKMTINICLLLTCYIYLHKLLEMSRNNARSHRIVAECTGEYMSDRAVGGTSSKVRPGSSYKELSVVRHSLLLSNRIKTAKIPISPIGTINQRPPAEVAQALSRGHPHTPSSAGGR